MENNLIVNNLSVISASILIGFITFCIGYKLGYEDGNRSSKEIR